MSLAFNPVPPNMWVSQSRLFHTNNGVIISESSACLIDPGIYPDELADIDTFLAEKGAVARTIVLTHIHWDHILGPEHFPGVPTTAQVEYPRLARDQGDIVLRDIANWERQSGTARERAFTIPQPDNLVEDAAPLQVGSLRFELLHVPGHSPDQLAVYHRGTGTLWASDILSDLEIPYVSHSLAAYEHTLSKLARLEIKALVPGHGALTTDPSEIHARLRHDTNYLAELRERVTQALRDEKGVEETAQACDSMEYRRPEENSWAHRTNVEAAYIELGGNADPRKYGWNKEWPQN